MLSQPKVNFITKIFNRSSYTEDCPLYTASYIFRSSATKISFLHEKDFVDTPCIEIPISAKTEQKDSNTSKINIIKLYYIKDSYTTDSLRNIIKSSIEFPSNNYLYRIYKEREYNILYGRDCIIDDNTKKCLMLITSFNIKGFNNIYFDPSVLVGNSELHKFIRNKIYKVFLDPQAKRYVSYNIIIGNIDLISPIESVNKYMNIEELHKINISDLEYE